MFRNELNRMLQELYNATQEKVTSSNISDGAVTSPKIPDNNIIDRHIANKTLSGLKIANGTLPGSAIENDSITAGKVAGNAINDKHIANKTLSGLKIADRTLPGNAIEPNSITELRIGNRQISNRNMALGAIEDENISLDTKIQNKKLAPDQFTMSVGKSYPFYSKTSQVNYKYDDYVYDMKVMNAEKNAVYKVIDISKDNEGFGLPKTYVRIARSFDDGINWDVIHTRDDNNLDNNQTGIKTVFFTNDNIQEEFILTLDWDGLKVGHNTDPLTGGTDYIVAPSNLFYTSYKEFKKPIKILFIGNSFSTDSAEYLFDICKSAEIDITVGISYDSGMGLEQTWNKLQNNETVTAYQKWTSGAGRTETSNALLSNIVADEDWDIVTFQQVSNFSNDATSFNPHITNLKDYVKANVANPDLRFALNMTWAFAEGSNRITNMGYNTQNELYEAISATYKTVLKTMDFDILFPIGTAIQNARTDADLKVVGNDLTRDESHLDKGIGRYIAALTLFEVLMTNNSNEVSFYPPDIDNAKYLTYLSKIAAKNAALNPFKVTEM